MELNETYILEIDSTKRENLFFGKEELLESINSNKLNIEIVSNYCVIPSILVNSDKA